LGTWKIVDLPPRAKAIPQSVVFREKIGPDGNVETRRARVVVRGHKQTYGVNDNETFAVVAKMPSVRVVLANGAQQDWEMHQVDVKSAYLNATLEDDISMIPPGGVLKPRQERKVCKLLKVIYGLKQAGREWQKMLTTVFVEDLGFQ
jgi:hypothetical protein